ncbi:unnamed protein product [Symbiodinium natans]|uniref:Ricin B lectin domain-containing protein n=1 Tax=Symbiodinium natans TaxID=878477 RepID=A0A812REU3_9DINO|nr:unnamed protein product [Symbiodinium natans]
MPSTAERDQLWLCVPCKDDSSYFHLCNRSSGMQVLEIRGGGPGHSAASLRLSEYSGGDRQKWKVDSGRITSKLDCKPDNQAAPLKFCIDVVGAQDANSAAVCAYAANGGRNQQWELEVVGQAGSARLVRIVSHMEGRRLLTVEKGDQMRKDMVLEIGYLARWSGEAGLVQLQKVVWNNGVPQAIIEERLGKQLGRGTGDADKACILQDIRRGLAIRQHDFALFGWRSVTPRKGLQRACSQLLSAFSTTGNGGGNRFRDLLVRTRCIREVAHVLRRIHSDGFAPALPQAFLIDRVTSVTTLYRIVLALPIELPRSMQDSYKLIDLGSVTRTASEHQASLDMQGRGDWRAFALAFLGLILNGRQLDVWVLIGTNSCIKASSGLECSWSSPSSDQAGIPQDVEEMLTENRGLWAAWEELLWERVLLALFARCGLAKRPATVRLKRENAYFIAPTRPASAQPARELDF